MKIAMTKIVKCATPMFAYLGVFAKRTSIETTPVTAFHLKNAVSITDVVFIYLTENVTEVCKFEPAYYVF